jgi:TRAP-type mannitol/chloroaromatic compound transport system substrate-binding protein
MNRRAFLGQVGAGASATGALASTRAWAQPRTFNWRLVTSYPPGFPIYMDGPERMAKLIEEQSQGRIKIKVFAAGELLPALGVFDAVSQGTVEMGASFASFWAGRIPAAQIFGAIPFGFNAQQFNAWLFGGEGLKLWQDLYKPYNVLPLPGGNTGVTAAGWFRRKINSVADLKGLKMRIPGLGGKVMAKAGATVSLLAPGEIYPALERGVIDAAEFVGPLHDVRLGLHNAARYYYFPGWHEPGAVNELLVNLKVWESLPGDLKRIVQGAAADYNNWSLSQFEARNADAFAQLATNPKVEILTLSDEVLRELRQLSKAVMEEEAAKDVALKRIYDDFLKFQAKILSWGRISEEAYYRALRA